MIAKNPKEAIDAILKLTGWHPDVSANGKMRVELDAGVLEFFAPNELYLILRQEVLHLPEDEFEALQKCREAAKINAGLAKLSRNRIVLEQNSLILEQVLTLIDLNESHIDEIFEDFLNNIDYIKNKIISNNGAVQFSPLNFLV